MHTGTQPAAKETAEHSCDLRASVIGQLKDLPDGNLGSLLAERTTLRARGSFQSPRLDAASRWPA